ncbi:MAG TPA: hypothetical protein VD978_12015 [Azospirillum sp.]|nr:hypothetical protein [Azospirillum sp.]
MPMSGPSGGTVVDRLTELARRRGIDATADTPVADLLAVIDPQALVPQHLVLMAGAVMAFVFRYDRMLADPASDDADELPIADRSI